METTEPSDEELREFVSAMLSNLERVLHEPEVIDESIREYRDTWILLYRASSGFGDDS